MVFLFCQVPSVLFVVDGCNVMSDAPPSPLPSASQVEVEG